MRKKERLAGILAAILLFTLAGCARNGAGPTETASETASEETAVPTEDAVPQAWAVMEDHSWDRLEKTSSYEGSREDLEREMSEAVQEIAAFTGYTDWAEKYAGPDTRILVYVDSGASRAFTVNHIDSPPTPVIYLNAGNAEYGVLNYYHEFTHILFYGEGNSVSLREGFATYVEDTLSDIPSPRVWGVDLHTIAKCYVKLEEETALDVVGTSEASNKKFANLRQSDRYLYTESASFIRYLVETYGMESFLRVYRGETPEAEYEAAMGKSLEELKADWLQFLEQWPEELTQEEIFAEMDKTLAEYGIPVEGT